MRHHLRLLGLFTLLLTATTQAQQNFSNFFKDSTLRIDYYHIGNAKTESIITDRIQWYPFWAGNPKHYIDSFPYGAYRYKLIHAKTAQLLFSKGFDSYFKEYQTSNKALQGEQEVFHETAVLPYPTVDVFFVVEKREKTAETKEVFRQLIKVEELTHLQHEPIDPQTEVISAHKSGHHHKKVDVVILGEGYTAAEKEKFKADLFRFSEVFFQHEPFASNSEQFNISGVFHPSIESGTDEPRAGIYRNTVLNTSFNALGSERYLLTKDNQSVNDLAFTTPFDAIYIMVNHNRYGGGGIYNFFCTFTSDNINSNYLMIHEFGHSFFGLADEYYTSSTAYNDFYTADSEPTEANITAETNPDLIKWKHLLTKNTTLPTPWNKLAYDSTDVAWQQYRTQLNDSIAELQQSGASPEAIAAAKKRYNELSAAHDKKMQTFLEESPFKGVVGAFEGAGYQGKGLYRPALNCIMFTRTHYFCPVCSEAMQKTIDWYSK
jgi:hypothetical protein